MEGCLVESLVGDVGEAYFDVLRRFDDELSDESFRRCFGGDRIALRSEVGGEVTELGIASGSRFASSKASLSSPTTKPSPSASSSTFEVPLPEAAAAAAAAFLFS
jgi:hypothetical protein